MNLKDFIINHTNIKLNNKNISFINFIEWCKQNNYKIIDIPYYREEQQYMNDLIKLYISNNK